MWQFYARLEEPKELVVIDAADHLFEGKTQEVGEALEDLLADFAPEPTRNPKT
jgi:alpha/beta superfamily hydrolase